MKKLPLLLLLAALTVVGCAETDVKDFSESGTQGKEEISVTPISGAIGQRTRGYVQEGVFSETYRANLHDGSTATYPRQMKISAYLHPQNGVEKNYFVGKTYAKGSDGYWHAKPDPVYWPVGSKMDFLAYSLTEEAEFNVNVNAVWDSENAAKQVMLTVPGENTQNDILYASAAGVKSSDNGAVEMKFNHSQAWLEFAVKGNLDGNGNSIVHLQKIELENVYNAGKLLISNNGGNAVAAWDFTGEERQNIPVDDFNGSGDLTGSPMYFDMLIPQQQKTDFVLYYTLGSSPKVLRYKFSTDLKTWLMGEKYVYNISITSSEVTVSPTVTSWEPVVETESKIKINYDADHCTVSLTGDGIAPDAEESTAGCAVYKCSTWGATGLLETAGIAGEEAEWRFDKWADGCTTMSRTIEIKSDATYEPLFTDEGPVVTVAANNPDYGKVTLNGSESILSLKVAPGTKVNIEATPTDPYIFIRWDDNDETAKRTGVEINAGVTFTANFGVGPASGTFTSDPFSFTPGGDV